MLIVFDNKRSIHSNLQRGMLVVGQTTANRKKTRRQKVEVITDTYLRTDLLLIGEMRKTNDQSFREKQHLKDRHKTTVDKDIHDIEKNPHKKAKKMFKYIYNIRFFASWQGYLGWCKLTINFGYKKVVSYTLSLGWWTENSVITKFTISKWPNTYTHIR